MVALCSCLFSKVRSPDPAKTLIGEVGLSKSIRDRLQNHALNDVSSKHYDRYDYLPEKRKALELWESKLLHKPIPSSNVVSFR